MSGVQSHARMPKPRTVFPSRPSRLLVISAPILLPITTILATADCYGPTEVTAIVSTDLACSEGPHTTGFFKGDPGRFDSTSQAETTACSNEPSGTGGTVGTLVFVPSGSPDGEAAVKVILARPGKLPTACLTDPKDCIIARRTFNYGEHISRRLPIRLLRECLGVACSETETCVGAPARCVSAKTICEGASCLLPEEQPSPPGSETGAGSETGSRPDGETLPDGATPDVDQPDPVVSDCESSTGRLATAAVFPTARLVAASTSTLYYVKGETPDIVNSISKLGGKEVVAFRAASGVMPRVRSIAVDGNGLVVGWESSGTRWVKPATLSETVIGTSTPINDVAAAPDAVEPRIYAATTNEVFYRLTDNTWTNPAGAVGAARIVAGTSAVYFVTAAGTLNRFPRGLATTAGVTGAPTNAVFYRAINNTIYAAGALAGKGAIGTLNNATFNAAYSNLSEIPASIGLDGSYYYYHTGNVIYRIDTFGNNMKSMLATDTSGDGIDHVIYDEDLNGCVYYWRKIGAGGQLIVRRKRNF